METKNREGLVLENKVLPKAEKRLGAMLILEPNSFDRSNMYFIHSLLSFFTVR